MRLTSPSGSDPVTHIARTALPWRDDALGRTICGHPVSQFADGRVINLRDAHAAVRRLGQQRFALLHCMTCASNAFRWAEWDDDPVARMERELSGGAFGKRELQRAGWTFHSRHRDLAGGDYELWTRPGKTPRDGASASLYYHGSDVLKVFTSSAAPLVADETYTLWGFHVALEHGGDHAAAARHVRALMPKPPRRARCPHCGSTNTEVRT